MIRHFAAADGCPMKSDVVTTIGLVFESYILQVDGEVKSEHRRFIDALRAAFQLKQISP
jgi:hypothetical protein